VIHGMVFDCPKCGTKLAGERTGNKGTFPNTCPECLAHIIVSATDDELRITTLRPIREFIRKEFTEVRCDE